MLLQRIFELEAQQPWIKSHGLPVAYPQNYVLPHVVQAEGFAEDNSTRTESINPVTSSGGTIRTRGRPKRGTLTCHSRVTTHLYAVVEESEEDSDSSPTEDDYADGDYAPPRKIARPDTSPEPVRRSSRPKRIKKDVLDVPDPSPRRSRVPRKQRNPIAGTKADAVTTATKRSGPPPSSVSPPRLPDLLPNVMPGPSSITAMNPYMTYYSPNSASPTTPTYAPNPYFYMTTPGIYPQPPPSQPPRTSPDVQRQAKPKRLKAHTVVSRSFNIPTVPRDKSGKPMLPLNVGIMTVISLGEICTREHFHTERYIFPVGYEVTRSVLLHQLTFLTYIRRYLSTLDPAHEVVYHCTILDGGDGPKFQIIPSDNSSQPIIAGTATGAWSSIVKQANLIRNRQHSNSVSGPDFFGLGQNTIKHLIQELEGAEKLRDYVWQTFVEGGPLGGRHAAVIPALPEEWESSAVSTGTGYLKRENSNEGNRNNPNGSLSYYPPHVVAQARTIKPAQQQQHSNAVTEDVSNTSDMFNMQAYQEDQNHSKSLPSFPPSLFPDSILQHPQAEQTHAVPATFASIMNAYPPSGA